MRQARRASLRRRRALVESRVHALATLPAPQRQLRRRTAQRWNLVRRFSGHRALNALSASWEPDLVAEVFDLRLYAQRYLPGGSLELPFDAQTPFSCLLDVKVHIADEAFDNLAQALLDAGMRFVLISGVESERLCERLNDLLDAGVYHENGRHALGHACDGEPLAETLEYFLLPSDLAPVNLLLTIGDAAAFRQTRTAANAVVQSLDGGRVRIPGS